MLHREACGAPGCDFVAGPSRDQNRVMRIADAHRAAHRLDAAALTEPQRRAPVAGSATEYRQQSRLRAERIVPHLASYRRFEPASASTPRPSIEAERAAARSDSAQRAARRTGATARKATEARRQARQERLARLSSEAWSCAS